MKFIVLLITSLLPLVSLHALSLNISGGKNGNPLLLTIQGGATFNAVTSTYSGEYDASTLSLRFVDLFVGASPDAFLSADMPDGSFNVSHYYLDNNSDPVMEVGDAFIFHGTVSQGFLSVNDLIVTIGHFSPINSVTSYQNRFGIGGGTATFTHLDNLNYNSINSNGEIQLLIDANTILTGGVYYSIVPEPSSYALLLGSLAIGLVAMRRRNGAYLPG